MNHAPLVHVTTINVRCAQFRVKFLFQIEIKCHSRGKKSGSHGEHVPGDVRFCEPPSPLRFMTRAGPCIGSSYGSNDPDLIYVSRT